MSKNIPETITSNKLKRVWVALTILVALLILTLLVFAYIYTESSKDKAKISLTSNLGLMSQEMINIALNLEKSGNKGFDQVKILRGIFEQKIRALYYTEKHNVLGLSKDNFDNIKSRWTLVSGNVDIILRSKEAVVLSRQYIENIHRLLPSLQQLSEQVVLELKKENEGDKKQSIAIHQIIRLQKLQNSLLMMLDGSQDPKRMTHEFVDNIEQFNDQTKLLLSGNNKQKIEPVINIDIRNDLKKMFTLVSNLSEQLGALLDYSGTLQSSRRHIVLLSNNGKNLFIEVQKLENTIAMRGKRLQYLGVGSGILALLSLLGVTWLMYILYKDRQRQLELTTADNERHQEAIINLLEKMTALSEGDLTVSARVTEDITGALSDAFNYTVEALRILVTKINDTSGRLNEFARKAGRTSARLSDASHIQSEEIVSASSVIVTFSESVERIAKYANNAARAADHSLKISKQGVQAVKGTIVGMHSIREQVQSTAKRIKRLSESSQEITQITQLMNDIGEQTQMLALNASIQMSSAGDAGKGFGSVADEVQQLAKRASATSSKVNVLVKTIQEDTNETVSSMEETIANVVSGTASAEKSGQALEQIDKESSRLAALMMNIANITNEQTAMANDVTGRMVSIQDITLQAFERANETSDLINSLTTTANELQESVYRFTLPDRSSRR